MAHNNLAPQLLLAMLQAEHEVVKACNRVYNRYGVTYHQVQILWILAQADGPLAQGTIGEHLLVSKANLSGLIDRLVAARLVRRTMDRRDRRVVRVALTETGRRTVAAIEPMRDTVESILFADIGAEEAAMMIDQLQAVAVKAQGIG